MKFAQYLIAAIVLQCVLSNPVPYYKPLTPEEGKYAKLTVILFMIDYLYILKF